MITSSAEKSYDARPLLRSFELALDRSLAWSIALAVLAIPLVVLPESEFLTITNLPKVVLVRVFAGGIAIMLALRATAYVVSAALTPGAGREISDDTAPGTLHLFLKRPAIWLPAAAALVMAGTAVSAAFSIHSDTSLRGIDPGESHRDLYTTGAYFVLFIGTLAASRSMRNIRLFSHAIALGGTVAALVGAAQYFGLSPFGISGTYGERITGTAGNPLFFGSILVMTFPFAVFSLALWARKNGYPRAYWAVLTLLATVFFFSAAGTASRAVLAVAVLVSIAVLAGLVRAFGIKRTYAYGASFLAALSVAMLVNVTVPSNVRGDSGEGGSGGLGGALERNRLDGDHLSGIADSRFIIWATTLNMVTARPQSPEWDTAPGFVRHIAGYGPDTFRYTHQYGVGEDRINVTTSHAHNEVLNRWVEQGLLGLVSLAALWIAAVGTGVWLLIKSPATGTTALTATAILVALAGAGLSYMSGIPQPGDTVLLWAMLGMLSGLMAQRLAASGPADGRSNVVLKVASRPYTPPLVIAAAIPLAILALLLSWSQNVPYLQASAQAADALQARDYRGVESRLERATGLAPNVTGHYALLGQARTYLAESDGVSAAQSAAAHAGAYAAYKGALDARPYDREISFRAAQSAWSAASAGGDITLALKAISIYEKLQRLTPNDPILAPRLEAMRAAVSGAAGQALLP